MKKQTVAQLLKHDFDKGPLYLYDSNNNLIYYENSSGYWWKREYDVNGNQIYFENSNGTIRDNRPKESCEGKVVEIDGKKYQLKEFD
jgi:hypothetical protein